MALVLVAKLLFHHQRSIGCTNTYCIDIIIGVSVRPFTPWGDGNDSIVRAWVFPAFNHVAEFFENFSLHQNVF
jgi:hypothetical protein